MADWLALVTTGLATGFVVVRVKMVCPVPAVFTAVNSTWKTEPFGVFAGGVPVINPLLSLIANHVGNPWAPNLYGKLLAVIW